MNCIKSGIKQQYNTCYSQLLKNELIFIIVGQIAGAMAFTQLTRPQCYSRIIKYGIYFIYDVAQINIALNIRHSDVQIIFQKTVISALTRTKVRWEFLYNNVTKNLNSDK